MSAANGQARTQNPSVLREPTHAEMARDNLLHANNPHERDSYARDRFIRIAECHSRLAVAESIDTFSRVIDAIWIQAFAAFNASRTDRPADREGRTM